MIDKKELSALDEIDEIDEKLTEESDYTIISDVNITQYKSDVGFKTLMDGFNEKLYVLPKYQRNFVWTKKQVESLAASLIKGLPIPPIYVYRNEQKEMVILDGQQRIVSLFLYYIGKYFQNEKNIQADMHEILGENTTLEEGISLSDLFEKKFKNIKAVDYFIYEVVDDVEKAIEITYSKLPKKLLREINFNTITIIEINVNKEEHKNRILYKVFQNLNSGGTLLKNQELRSGIYQCEFYDMLEDINSNNPKWRKIYGDKHKHKRDFELLLRFSAVKHFFEIENESVKIKVYNASYPKFLNDFSDKCVKFNEDEIIQHKNSILAFIDKINVSSRIPNLLLESLFFATDNIEGDYIINDLLISKIKLDDYYKNAVDSASNVKVGSRFNYVYK